MSLDRIRLARKKTIGANQTAKAIAQSVVSELFVARDAQAHVVRPILSAAEQQGIPVQWVDSMKVLGKACGIEVGAATAAIVQD